MVLRFAFLLLLIPAMLPAQRDSRWEASTLFGFRSNGSLSLSSPASAGLARGSLDSSSLFSLTGGYRFDDATLIEFRYSRTAPGISLNAATPGFPDSRINATMNQFAATSPMSSARRTAIVSGPIFSARWARRG